MNTQTIAPELLEKEVDQLTEEEAKIRLQYAEGEYNTYRLETEQRERKDKKRRRWIIFPLFVLLGLLLGLLAGSIVWRFFPNCPEKPMYEKSLLVIDSLKKARIGDSLAIATLTEELTDCRDKLTVPTAGDDKTSKATTKGKKGTGNKHKKPAKKTQSGELIPPPPPPPPPINKDSAALFNNNDRGDLSDNGNDDTGGDKSRKKKSFAWEVVPESSGSSQGGWVKPTVYGLEGRKSRPTNYGVPLRVKMKDN